LTLLLALIRLLKAQRAGFLKVNDWNKRYKEFAKDHKRVTVRAIKMTEKTADKLRYSSKFKPQSQLHVGVA